MKNTDTLFQEGCRLHMAGRLEEAQTIYRQILRAQPRHAETLYLLGASCSQMGRHDEGITLLQKSLAIKPYYVDAHASLGEAFLALNRVEEAITSLEMAITLKPQLPKAFINLGNAWNRKGDTDKALACVVHAIKLDPRAAEAHYNLGNLLRDSGELDPAIACYQKALDLRPEFAEALSNLGYTYKHSGRLEEAVAAFRKAMQLKPDHATIHSGIAYLLQFHAGQDASAIYREQIAWAQRHAEPLSQNVAPHVNDRSPDRRLRIGYVSPDFRSHCQSFFTVPLLENHDHRQFEIFGYADVARPDALTQRLRGRCDQWRSTVGCTDEQIAEMIRADGIDIAVDLTMHMARNRLLVFARKPAPVQMTWLAYPGTTGLSALDYRLSDPHLDPPGLLDAWYAERTIRLPDTFWCYDPLTTEPQVNELPATKNGYVTFGCVNNFCKVNDAVLQTWARVLSSVANSRLILLCARGVPRQRTLDVLQRAGVAAERIEFVDAALRHDYLQFYHRMDIALDTFPYNGHTTSLDGLWMGVPVITLVGNTVVGRAGLSQLTNLKMMEFVTQSPEEYVGIAMRAAGDLEGLAHLRRGLRQRMEASPLMDGKRFARNIEAAYRQMWHAWCDRSAPRG